MSLPSVEDPRQDAAPYKTINEMHRYRDAILYRKQKTAGQTKGRLTHEVIGAYVLSPGRPDSAFDYRPFINEENIGAIPLLPGADGKNILHAYLDKFLGHSSAEGHLRGTIPTRGTSAFVGEGFSEKSILRIQLGTAEKFTSRIKPDGFGKKKIELLEGELSGRHHGSVRFIRFQKTNEPDVIFAVEFQSMNGAFYVFRVMSG